VSQTTKPLLVADDPNPLSQPAGDPAEPGGPQGSPGFITTVTGARQMVFPPDVPQYNPTWLSQHEQYLLGEGWEKEGERTGLPTYRDPKGSRLNGELRTVVELPNKGDDLHKTITVQQFHLPPATYSFTLEEAVDIQRRRDAHGDDGPTPLERLSATERRCNELERELVQTKARIKALLLTHQLTHEGLKLGLRELLGI